MHKDRKRPKKDADYLPAHIGISFQDELSILIDGLAQTEGFKGQYLKSEYLRKYMDDKVTPPDVRRARAITKWLDVEVKNKSTNARLMLGDEDLGFVHTDELIGRIRKDIAKVLGTLDLASLLSMGSHSNGASTRVKRAPTAHIDKHSNKAHVSTSAISHWITHSHLTRLSNTDLEIQESSVMFTVPKSSDIDRVACKEPEVNMLLQRCVGTHIKGRLRAFGIDLRDQSKNQILAKDALKRGLATIDLSSASDSITKSLVMELLPHDWWFVLDDLRSHSVVMPDGTLHELEMFSSMGNGFTFELETLLFWAITRAVCYFSGIKGSISVYGDDIIAPSCVAPRLQRVFFWFGFTVNAKKSHWSGLFRESCGKHYHDSKDVSPFYLRGPVRRKTHVIRILNRLLEWDSLFCTLCTESVILFHSKWSQVIPRSLWGGSDPESIAALVTGHRPACQLVNVEGKNLQYDDALGLTAWLTERSVEPVGLYEETSKFNRFTFPEEIRRIDSRLASLLSLTTTEVLTRMKIQVRDQFQWHTTWDPWGNSWIN